MAAIVPIRGWRYNAGSELALLIAPPYDVIDKDQQERFYALHPHNVIRLECGLALPGDHSANNRYTRAADYFKIWCKEGVLLQDVLPALYFYEQTYNLAGKRLTRRGFFSGLQLEPYGKNIFPHEDTLSAARADRMQLISTCKANFSPIFGLYADPERVVERLFADISRGKPEYDFTGEEQQKHRLWVVTDNKVIESAVKMLENRRVFIADGHHRFETALWYCLERQAAEAPSKPAPYSYVLTFLVNVYDPGLSILPTHRLVKTPAGFDLNDFLRAATEFFVVREAGEQVPLPRRRYAFGLYAGDNRCFRLTLKDGLDPVSFLKGAKPPAWKKSEVAVLHGLLLERRLGIGPKECTEGQRIGYTHDPKEACSLVDEGVWDLAFFLNPPGIKELITVAEAGERMPQKSTYFYPKVPSGLVIYSLEG